MRGCMARVSISIFIENGISVVAIIDIVVVGFAINAITAVPMDSILLHALSSEIIYFTTIVGIARR